jgi:hypothetical protein
MLVGLAEARFAEVAVFVRMVLLAFFFERHMIM